jgi:hypothetical protein
MTRTARLLLLLVILVAIPAALVAGWVWRSDGQDLTSPPGTFPSPGAQPAADLSPEDVIAVILSSLASNDIPVKDAGIATAFNFASNENQLATGPLPRFAEMVKSPAYAPLIDHSAAEVSNISGPGEAGVIFRVVVTVGSNFPVVEARGQRMAYIWLLSRQPVPDRGICWVTDGVAIAPDQPKDPPPPPSGPTRGS